MSLYGGFFNDYESIIWNFLKKRKKPCFFILNCQFLYVLQFLKFLSKQLYQYLNQLYFSNGNNCIFNKFLFFKKKI